MPTRDEIDAIAWRSIHQRPVRDIAEDRGHRALALCVRWSCDAWKAPQTNEWLLSFAIITTEPNELTALVHNRTPVILQSRNYDQWLRGDGRAATH